MNGEAGARFERIRRRVGLAGAPLLFTLLLLLPLPLPVAAHRLAAVMAAVVVLWISEALPMPVTALLGVAACVVLGVAPAKEAFAPFADPLMFLFIGSFILARAIFLHGLDRRLAFGVLSLAWVGARPTRILFAFGAITAAISAWISNTATTAMMFAIGMSILSLLYQNEDELGVRIDPRFATGLGRPRSARPCWRSSSRSRCGWAQVALAFGERSELYQQLGRRLPEGVVALAGAGLLFLLPGKDGARAMNWKEASRIDWGIVLLYGGGFALGVLSFQSGLAEGVARSLTQAVPIRSGLGLVLAATAAAMLLSETTSNTASANMIVPVVIAVAQSAGVDPLQLALGATMGASLGFMLPVSTPCNAIVYSSGYIPLSRMMRYGLLLDVAGVLVISTFVWLLVPLLR